ncbi:Translation initiation factor eIF-2B subunit alpha [Pseudocercospora fuligena]|uniref:Translation initiation factor eIF2B subunit alpha n=1 Tax=Pseudocercospora fuligena TaxID=685502 RepID=A0A8H6RAJ4_9PEZI|nr:Translation initiation factor eIF-2B subunit alpha [Pseudocercospora fuligena]
MSSSRPTSRHGGQTFDVVSTYKRLLSEDPDLTMPVAAIEALILGLAQTPAITTVSETLDLIQTLTAKLKESIPNSISLSAGTDIFQQYLITNLQRPTAGDFDTVRNHLVQNGKLFVERAKAARDTIAGFGRHFINDGNVVLTNGGSRVVGALLKSAAESGGGSGSSSSIRFKVIYVVSNEEEESAENIAALRERDIPVATIPPTAIAFCLDQVTQCFVGAEGVVENGGIISRMGTYQMGMLAKAAGKPFYVVSESHKFVRLYPLGQRDLGIEQNVVDFKTARGSEGKEDNKSIKDEGVADLEQPKMTRGHGGEWRIEEAVDYTPPGLISGIITESGVLLPSAVSEELIKIWF